MTRYILLLIVIMLINGCQPESTQNLKKKDYSGIAGTWKSKDTAWQVTISEGGEITSAVHPMGTALIKPNETTYRLMKDKQKSSYKGGDFTLIYDEETREMQVIIIVEKIHIKYLNNEIKGETETIILGDITEDFTTWDAEIIEVFDYGPRFPQLGVSPKPVQFIKQ